MSSMFDALKAISEAFYAKTGRRLDRHFVSPELYGALQAELKHEIEEFEAQFVGIKNAKWSESGDLLAGEDALVQYKSPDGFRVPMVCFGVPVICVAPVYPYIQ